MIGIGSFFHIGSHNSTAFYLLHTWLVVNCMLSLKFDILQHEHAVHISINAGHGSVFSSGVANCT